MNDDLISRAEAIDAMSESLKRVFPEHRQIAEKCLKALPSAQPERKKGKWINIRHDNIAECDQCGITGRAWMNFCFNCGADMKEDA